MAKGSLKQYRREPLSRQPRQDGPSDAEVFSVVQNSDYVPPNPTPKPDQDDAPLKRRIALGYLTVNGREEPVFAPIQGFEHLFAHGEVAAPWAPQPSAQPRKARATEAARRSSKSSRSRKRRRTSSQSHQDAQDADEENEPNVKVPAVTTFNIGNVESLKAFYSARFRELTMKPMRDVVTAWVKRLEPKRQKKYGPYQRYEHNDRTDGRSSRLKSVKPPWWPATVPYVEPSHLKLQDLVPLAVDLMLIHRHIDEEVGKRKYPSWISKLETDAIYLISSKDTEHFSSSRGARYNEAMKTRALEVILPSLFDIAKSHEDYIAQYDLYEGSGNEDPGCGKQVSWQATPRPERELAYKRRCPSRKAESLHEENGDETEVDEEAVELNSTFSSFDSAFSYTEDVKMFPEAISNDPPSAPEATSAQPLYQGPTQTSDVTMSSAVDNSMSRLHLYETDSKAHPAFGMNPPAADIFPQCSTGLPYGYPHYLQLAQAPYHTHGPTGFATCGPVVPHDAVLANAPTSHVLPNSNQMHGLAMHQLPAHDLATHNMSSLTNWDHQY